MADHALSPGVRQSPYPDWPSNGVIRPLLSTRVERKAKALLSRARPVAVLREPTGAFDLAPVYRLAASPNPPTKATVLDRAFRAAVEPSQAIDATLAALALALASGNRSRSEGLLAFLELCYRPADLNAGASTDGCAPAGDRRRLGLGARAFAVRGWLAGVRGGSSATHTVDGATLSRAQSEVLCRNFGSAPRRRAH